MEKILIIGNSHSVDAFQLLHLAFQDQMPEEDVTLGILYYSGCSITKHIGFVKNGDAVCSYYKNTDGSYTVVLKIRSTMINEPMFELKIKAPTRQNAIEATRKWRDTAHLVYENTYEMLFDDNEN